MTEEQIQEIISTVEPEIADQEPVYGGFRVKQRRYIHDDGVLLENIEYMYPRNSDAWAAIRSITYEDGDPNDLAVFRSWNISDHPNIAGVFRRVDLVEMKINAPSIVLRVAVKHFSDEARTQSAPYASVLMAMFATDDMLINVPAELQAQGLPAQMGERAYWDVLTGLGMTPYQLLDARIPELDLAGRFNMIY